MKSRWEYVDRIGGDYIFRVYWYKLEWARRFPFFAWKEAPERVRGDILWYWYPSGVGCSLEMMCEAGAALRAWKWKGGT